MGASGDLAVHEQDMVSQEKLISVAPLLRPVDIRIPRSDLLVERGRIDSSSDQRMIARLKRSQVWY